MNSLTEIIFQPLIAWPWIIAIGMAAFALMAGISVMNRYGAWLRALFTLLVLLMIANPVVQETAGIPTETVINVVIDSSASQFLGKRHDALETAAATILAKLDTLENSRVNVTRIERADSPYETRAFTVLRNNLLLERPGRTGGSILVTDGQVHDMPEHYDSLSRYGPLHVVMTGMPDNEFDRHIKILSSPGYGLVGENLPVKIRVEESPMQIADTVNITVYANDDKIFTRSIPVGEDQTVQIPVQQTGEMLIRFDVDRLEQELSPVNNTAIVRAQGVRDKLKVLLVSGQPHQGLRIWRNLLKSDPAVELVHFTILRSFDSIDITPPDELALIPFPTEELFQQRIGDFDLIIMDRFTRRNILLPEYFNNIVNYVKKGGGLLVVHGPEEGAETALAETYLGDIFPYRRITGGIVSEAIKPVISPFGLRHPIMDPLEKMQSGWGDWARYIKGSPHNSTAGILLQTADNVPLLAIDEIGEGRIAQFMSDQIWLWARGYDGGGPYGSLMKRLAHWLMKEPTLDYRPLKVTPAGEGLNIAYNGEDIGSHSLKIRYPDGRSFDIDVTAKEDGESFSFMHQERTDLPGLYHITYGAYAQDAVLGDLNAPEIQELVSAPEKMEPAAHETGGSVINFDEIPHIGFALADARENYRHGNQVFFAKSTELENRHVTLYPLLPWWAAAAIGLCFMIMAWLRQE